MSDTMNDYSELVKELRSECTLPYNSLKLMRDAADAIEHLSDLVDRSIGFWDSKEIAGAMRRLNSYMPDVADLAWQKAHMDMGFYSPIGEVYKELGVYGEEE